MLQKLRQMIMKFIEIMVQEQSWEIVSSVSAQKLECPSFAQLGSEPFQLSSETQTQYFFSFSLSVFVLHASLQR